MKDNSSSSGGVYLPTKEDNESLKLTRIATKRIQNDSSGESKEPNFLPINIMPL